MIDLVYYSKARPGLSKEDIADILKTAREFNSKNNITGCLLHRKDEFLQILEGEKHKVLELLDKIKRDERHSDIVVLAQDGISKRMYTEWNMAFYDLDGKESEENPLGTDIISFSEIVYKPTNAIDLFFKMAEYLGMN